jgi:hypothetical protein
VAGIIQERVEIGRINRVIEHVLPDIRQQATAGARQKLDFHRSAHALFYG